MAIFTALSVAVAAYSAGASFVAAAGIFISGAGFAGQLLLSAATSLVLNALTPKPSAGGGSNRGYQVNSRGTALDHQIIYGKVKVGGAVVFDESTGENNQFLHRIIAVAGHEVESFDRIYINDSYIDFANIAGDGNIPSVVDPDGSTSTRYNGKVRIQFAYGTPSQPANASLVSESPSWTEQHTLSGIAYMYVRLNFDADVFPNGVPVITAEVKGKKVFDPRTSTTAWSDNPALCLRDYLTSKYGVNENTDNIDDALVISAANVCDQTISGSPRYTCNGAFTTGSTPYDLLQGLLTPMGGTLWYAQGKWRMKPAYWTTPVMDLNEDDFRSSVGVSTRHSRRDNFNVVKGTFRGEETNWQVTDYPQVTNATFVVADGGQESVVDVDLAFTDNSIEARRLARIALEANRQQLTISASFGLSTLALQVGDNVRITNSRFGWTNKEFTVMSWSFGLADEYDLQVNMVLQETAESIFDEVNDGIVYERDNTNLLSPFEAQPVGMSIGAELRVANQQVVGVLVVDVVTDSPFLDRLEVEFKRSDQTDFITLGQSSSGRFEAIGVSDGFFDVRARSINVFGIKGQYNTITNFYATLFEQVPEDVTNFSANVVGNTLHLSWTPVGDLDLSHYKLRYSSLTSGAEYQKSIDLVQKISRPANTATVPAQSGTYFIKAVDKLGIASSGATSIVIDTNVADIDFLNIVETQDEHPNFLGAKNGVVVVNDDASNFITLDTSLLFDEASGDFDDALGLFDGGFGSVLSSGTYDFDGYIDLGEKYVSRVTTSMLLDFLDYVNDFDSALGFFDAREGDFDGDPSAFDTTSVKTQVSTTNDDPAGSPVWSEYRDFIVGDINARALRFRAVLASTSGANAPAVRELSVEVDMPDRVEAQSDLTYTGSRVINFPVAFKEPPALGIAATLADGDRYVISSKSRSGFTITTLTGASTSTNPTTIDYVAKGYGKEIA